MTPRPKPRAVCTHCNKRRVRSYVVLDEQVCQNCWQRFRRNAQPCPICGEPKVLAFYDDRRRPSCATCTGNEPIFACPACGREDSPFGTYCGECTLEDRLVELLTDPTTGAVHKKLVPVFHALMHARRPQTTLYWLNRASSRPDILRAMASGKLPISHNAFDDLPATRNVAYIRDLLTATGVLPHYQIAIERITRWLNDILTEIPKPHADVIERFARWHLLRRLRLLDADSKLSRGAIQHARAAVLSAIRFLAWLDQHDLTLATLGQADLDRYLVEHPTRATTLGRGFLRWTEDTGRTCGLSIPMPSQQTPDIAMSHDQRWLHVEKLLHDNTIRTYTRIAGLFMLLFAQPLSRVLLMRLDQISVESDDQVAVTFDTVAIELPDPLDLIVLDHLEDRGPASYTESHWLFPGRLPGKPLVTENVRNELVAHGIPPSHARKAAMFQLAAEMPTPVLADILGLSNTTAVRWATLAARDWSHYAAMRRRTQ